MLILNYYLIKRKKIKIWKKAFEICLCVIDKYNKSQQTLAYNNYTDLLNTAQ